MKISERIITLTEEFQCTANALWLALVEREQMTQWYFDNIPDFEPKIGFQTEFLIQNEGRAFTHQWEVLNVVPGRRISYRWRYKEYPGEAVIHFSLEHSNPVTLTVTMEVLADFPDDVPEFERSSCQGGWDYFIKESLAGYLSLKR